MPATRLISMAYPQGILRSGTKKPHHAVCCVVLNLPKQVRILPEISVLA